MGKELGQEAVLEGSEMMKGPLRVLTALSHQEVKMGVEIHFLSERLNDSHDTRDEF